MASKEHWLKDLFSKLTQLLLSVAGLSGLVDSVYPDDRNWWRKSLLVKVFSSILLFLGVVWVLMGLTGFAEPNDVWSRLQLVGTGLISIFISALLFGWFRR